MTTIASEKDLITKDAFDNRAPAIKTIVFMEEINSSIKIMQKDIQYICEELKDNKTEHVKIMAKIDDINNKISDFGNVKSLVYGTVKVVLTAVVLALLGLIIYSTR